MDGRERDVVRPDFERRPGETSCALPAHYDAGLFFIGRIRTPWKNRGECPRRGDFDGPECRLEIETRWAEALTGLADHTILQVLYWMHLSRRDLTVQSPRHAKGPSGTFALRSPMRPNPIASSLVRLVGVAGSTVVVRGLDCVDDTPLLDLKPDHCPSWEG